MSQILILLAIYIVLPVFIIILTEKNNLANRIGAIIIAYVAGLILGHIGIIPTPGDTFKQLYNHCSDKLNAETISIYLNKGLISENDILFYKIRKMQDLVMSVMIPLAIPLLLFSINLKSWFRLAGKTIVSTFISIIVVLVVLTIGFLIFKSDIKDLHKISGLLVGLYTGGIPNLAALKIMLNVSPDAYILTHTYDTVISALYLFFLITIGKNIFRKILVPYPVKDGYLENESIDANGSYVGFFTRKKFLSLLLALFIAVVIFASSFGVSLLFNLKYQMVVVILLITTFGIIASLIKKINQIDKSFELGMYFVLVFSIVIASMADLRQLSNISISLLLYVFMAIFGTLFLHTLFCRIFKVDADTLIITSTALICSAPFVPMVAASLKNKEIIVSGLTVGIFGYAIGNYMGVFLSYFLSHF